MRFIYIDQVKEGMVLGKTLRGKNGEFLLREGAVLCSAYIKKIKILGYNGVYIRDDLSNEIEITEMIDENLKYQAINAIKDIFNSIEQGKTHPVKIYSSFKGLVDNIVESVLENRNALINIIDLKLYDDYTFYHSVNVCILSIVLGKTLNFNKKQLQKLALSAILHDIGKTHIPKEILNKNSRLSNEEFEIIKTHSYRGYCYVKDNFDIPPVSYIGILHHHEKFDGSGYPAATRGNSISLFGRIISIADVYDAITSNRPYRKGLPPHEAIEYIMGNSGIAFDPKIVEVFTKKVVPYPEGTCVRLSNNCTGLVVRNYPDCCTRPKVKVLKHDGRDVEPYYIDLKKDKNYINTVIKDIT